MMFENGNLGDLVDRTKNPDAVALIDATDIDRPVTLTHAELDARANAVARMLLARGLQRGERVGILAANSADYLAVYFGTMRAGLVSVPINWRFPKETIAYVLQDSEVKVCFVDDERRASLPAEMPTLPLGADLTPMLDFGPFEIVRPSKDEWAMILYTSGSTGRPKGVPLTHHGHLWVLEARSRYTKDVDQHRFLVAAPMYHMNALAISKFALSNHASIVVLPQFSAPGYIRAIERFGCTWLTSVPTMIALVVQQAELLARSDLSSVKVVTMGSAPTTPGLFEQIRAIFSGARIAYGFGTSEAGPAVFGPHPDGRPTPDLGLGWDVIPEVRLRLVGEDGLDAMQGELWMDCPARTPGYLNLPERSAQAITPDGYYRTGDVMRRDESGCFYFVGRVDDMFVCNGENVFPGEVESLLETHPGIAQACVVPVPDDVRGAMPVAFVVLAGTPEAATLDEDTVKQFAIAHAPAYMHPRRVWFVDVLPLASTNKIDRKVLIGDAKTRMGIAA